MSAFDECFSALMGVEKGYTVDAGGPTMYGVTEAVARAHGYTGDMRDLPIDAAKQIARAEYWDRFQCDAFDPRIGFQLFDTAYNGGHPIQWLQTSVGVTADGVVGPHTVAAVQAADVRQVVMRFIASRLEYWCDCAAWPQAGKGWARRGASNLRKGAV